MPIPQPPLIWLQAFAYCRDPRLLRFHFSHQRRAYALVAALSSKTVAEAVYYHAELREDWEFLEEVVGRFAEVVEGYHPRGSDFMYLTRVDSRPPFRVVCEEAGGYYFHPIMLYMLVRAVRPARIIETGGTPGFSSAFMLRALDRNGNGELHTIDLPPEGELSALTGEQGITIHAGMPGGKTSGWIVPDALRERHHQHLGDSRQLLPGVLDSTREIDLFIHDSDHSYEHMTWEFKAAWPRIRSGGALLSDDVGANVSFQDFSRAAGLKPLYAGGFGGVVKP